MPESAHPAFRAQAPDYPPYTQFTSSVPKDLGGFSLEIGHALEAVCGVKVEFILDSWSECYTAKPKRLDSFRRGAPPPPDPPQPCRACCHNTPPNQYPNTLITTASPLSPFARV